MTLVVGLMTPALLAGCGANGDLISTVALPSRQSPDFVEGVGVEGVGGDQGDGAARPQAGPVAGGLQLTTAQRGYLDDLLAAGIHPSSELRALSIGSYICQARAAGQSDADVRDYVAPMIRSDVTDSHAAAPQTQSPIPVEGAISEYIRSATERLC